MAPWLTPPPFVLLEDLESGVATLFERPRETLVAKTAIEVVRAIDRADELIEAGHAIAGWVGYEAGYAFEPRLHALLPEGGTQTLLQLFSFAGRRSFPCDDVDDWLASHAAGSPHLDRLEPAITFEQYAASFHQVKEAIAAGDIYQANLTFPLRGRWRGDPVGLYRAIRPEAKARFAALVFTGVDWLLSFSPELFFSLQDRRINVRPMKGTRPRGTDPVSDRRYACELAESVKDRAENLMIVDLLRNDLSRISRAGSVKVDELFRIESYPTVFQMTTGVSAEIRGDPSLSRVIKAMFPCGSITGAPKVRAMEIIHEVEHWSRGPYCGSVGEFAKTGSAHDEGERGWHSRFNVAIRTLRLTPEASASEGSAIFGVGSGIVADSVLEEEWEECLLKARFVDRGLSSARNSAFDVANIL